ncbi:MAG TPA: hypothetical protein VL832_23525, partial [Puia sp.]|nr:hypothetical protein [Puia sp.]
AELSAANTFSGPPTAAEALLQHLAEARGLRQTLVQMNEGASTREEGRTEGTRPEEVAAGAEGVAQPGAAEKAPGRMGEEGAGPVEDTARASENEAAPGNASQAGQETPTSPVQEPSTAIVAHAMAMAEPLVEFEPYHTIDYFASVGIKFVQDENPSDKLGKQLKSFTDWLKVMRKLPQKNQEIVPDMAAEHQIQAIAAHSIKGKEVLTETMAEVLVKQGMREKAVEVYHKLSLLNPDKSAYFAAKIEQLKID